MGITIGRFRKRANLSQRDLALKIGICEEQVREIEKGAKRPDLNMLDAIAKAVNTTPLAISSATVGRTIYKLVNGFR